LLRNREKEFILNTDIIKLYLFVRADKQLVKELLLSQHYDP